VEKIGSGTKGYRLLFVEQSQVSRQEKPVGTRVVQEITTEAQVESYKYDSINLMISYTREKTENEKAAHRHWESGDLVVTSVPHWMQVIGNTNCNIRCPFCFAWNEITRPRDQHTDLTDQAVRSLTEFISRGTCMVEMFGGGEILLSPAFWQFLKVFDRSRLESFGILSNFVAELQDVELLAEKLDYLKISIAGASPEIYEQLMRGAKWDRLMANIRAVREAGLDTLWLIFILHRSNRHQIRQIMDLSEKLGVEHLLFKQLDRGPNQEWYERENVAAEAESLAEEVNRLKTDYSFTVYSDLEHGGSGLLVFMDSVDEAIRRGYVCKSPWHSLESHLDGKIFPCCYNMQVQYGNINTSSPEEIWNGQVIRQFRKDLLELKYRERGCAPQCPDLALQLKHGGETIVVDGIARKKD